MAEFPPNLDDGELWLPSDIFPVDDAPSRFSPHHPELSYMEDLARRFAAYALLERNRTQRFPKPSPNLERSRPPARHVSAGSLPGGYLGLNAGPSVIHGLHGYGAGGVRTGSRPVFRDQILNPVQLQVDSFMEARARVMQRQQERFMQNRTFENRFLPFQRSGVGVGGGLVRESGGTGVFLPRIATTTYDARTRQGVRNRQESQVFPRRKTIGSVDVRKQECHYQLPPEMGLPQDWTY